MKFGQERMNLIIDKLFAGALPYLDSVIIGDNSSGKTMLLKLFIEKIKSDGAVYFIDTVNRGFDLRQIEGQNIKKRFWKQGCRKCILIWQILLIALGR